MRISSLELPRRRQGYRLAPMVATITLFACGGDVLPTTVSLNPVVAVSISSPEIRLAVGNEAHPTAQAFDGKGRALQADYHWSSANPAVAAVSAGAGVVRAISPGATTLTVSTGSVSATAKVIVRLPDPAAAIFILRTDSSLIAGSIQTLSAVAYDSTGRPVAGVPIEWTSSNPGVATVSKGGGELTALSPGSTSVTATSGTLATTATISVTKLAASYAFTRWSVASDGSVTSQVMSYSAADAVTRSFAGKGKFAKIDRPSWSRDGTLLTVEVIYDFFDYPAVESVDYSGDIFVIDPSAPPDAPWRALTTNGLSKSPRWSNDGTRIAYLEEPTLLSLSQIYTIDPSGGRRTRVTNIQTLCGRPSWSPDGTRLAFTDWLAGDIYLINADGTGLTNLTHRASWETDPSWSPDGKHIAFASSRASMPGNFRIDIYVVDVDGSNVRQLTSIPGYAASPEWSPDGSQIMFSAGDISSGGALYVMNADGSSIGRLTTPPSGSHDISPAWRR